MFLKLLSATLRGTLTVHHGLRITSERAFEGITRESVQKIGATRCFTSHSTEETVLSSQKQNESSKVNKNEQFSQNEIHMLNQDPDSFGTLSLTKPPVSKDMFDKVETNEKNIRKIRSSDQKSIEQYEISLKHLVDERNLQEACRLFEEQMLKNDKILAPVRIYEWLIDECLKRNNETKAFDIYEHMVNRSLKISISSIEKLLLAYESSNLTFRKVKSLCKILEKYEYKPNEKIYNALIRTNIRAGQWPTGFEISDKMVHDGFQYELETITLMFQGCCHDKSNGFYRILELWHEMLTLGYIPNINTYNAFLKAIAKCELNDVDKLQNTLKSIKKKYQQNVERNVTKTDEIDQINDCRPNLLQVPPKTGSLFPLKNVTNPVSRLIILGGISNILKKIKELNITPTAETIITLLNLAPNTFNVQQKLITLLKKHNIRPDLEIFDTLLRNSCMRKDFNDAREIIELMHLHDIEVELPSYGILSLSCKSANDAVEFFDYAKNNNVNLNDDILNAMLKNACTAENNDFVIQILRKMQSKQINPLEESVQMIQAYQHQVFRNLRTQRVHNQKTRNECFKFIREHKQWLKHFRLDSESVKKSTMVEEQKKDGKPTNKRKIKTN